MQYCTNMFLFYLIFLFVEEEEEIEMLLENYLQRLFHNPNSSAYEAFFV